jgi:hypothetical protein
MVDWNGLLNWTVKLQQEEQKQNGGLTPQEFKPMSEEDAKWLEAALESVSINEMKEIFKILDRLKEPEEDERDIEDRLKIIDDLLVLVDGLENGRNIVRAKRFDELIQYFYTTKSLQIKISLANVLTSMLQNDKYVQEAAIELGLFKQLLIYLNETEDMILMDKYIYLLTGLLYGDYERPKKLFLLDYDGLKLINNLLIKNKENVKNFKRLLSIIKELSRKEDKHCENYNTKFLLIDKMKEIGLHKMLLSNLDNTEYSKSEDFEIRDIIFEIFNNTIRAFDSLDEIYKVIENLNNKIKSSKIETEKEEKLKLVHVIKDLKTEFTNYEQFKENGSSNIEVLENGNLAIKLKD